MGTKQPWVLVCGSIAIDFLGVYDGSFEKYEEKYKIRGLNISLQLTEIRSSFGGCGLNIAYGLHRLSVPVIPLSVAGTDYLDRYQEHLTKIGIETDYIAVDQSLRSSATALVISDKHGNQITGFYAGAASSPIRRLPSEIRNIESCRIGILAPEGASIMLRQARNLAELDIPIIFDPGQGIADFSEAEINELVHLSNIVMINSHEYQILLENSQLSEEQLLDMLEQLVVTRGAKGVDVYESGRCVHVPAVEGISNIDPTGCSDAFRAGYIYGLMGNYSTKICARIGCVIASINLENRDTQTYECDEAILRSRYRSAYGDVLN